MDTKVLKSQQIERAFRFSSPRRLHLSRVKTIVSVALFFFVAFLATPTLVSLIERSSDTSAFFTMNEEEQSPTVESTLVADVWNCCDTAIIFVEPLSSDPIPADLRVRHDNVTPTIFAPPPNA